MYVDFNKLQLKFIINGKDQGIAFENIKRGKYKAAIDFYNQDDSVTLISSDYKRA